MPYRNRETYRVVVRDSKNNLLVMNSDNQWVDILNRTIIAHPRYSSMSLTMMTDKEISEYRLWQASKSLSMGGGL